VQVIFFTGSSLDQMHDPVGHTNAKKKKSEPETRVKSLSNTGNNARLRRRRGKEARLIQQTRPHGVE